MVGQKTLPPLGRIKITTTQMRNLHELCGTMIMR